MTLTTPRSRRSRPAARYTSRVVAPVLAMCLASGLVWQTSTAAFTATTNDTGNTFSAGALTLTDDDSTTAMFTAANMVPTDTVTKCIKVTYTGNTFKLAPVKLYGAITAATGSVAIADYLNVKVEEGNGGDFSSCTGFAATGTLYDGTLTSLVGSHSNYANGLSGYTPTSGSTARTYRFTVTLNSNTPNTVQGSSATSSFTWEVQSA